MPRLIAIAGPFTGGIYDLPDQEFTIGRTGENLICLADHGVSRKHCSVHLQEGRWMVRDLASRNGTIWNGQSVTEQELSEGDELKIGSSRFRFTNEVSAEVGPESHTRELNPSDLQLASRPVQELETLLRMSSLLHSFRGLRDSRAASARDLFGKHLLSVLFELFPAEYGAVLVYEGALEPAAAYSQGSETPNARVLERVRRKSVAVWLDAIDNPDEWEGPSSMSGRAAPSILAAPVVVRESLALVLYLGTRNQERRFEEGHLQVLVALCGLAAVAWENAQYLEWLSGENERLAQELDVEHEMVGHSAKLKQVQTLVGRVASSETTVLILGESGTGKELIARAIHRNSPRQQHPFVAINCAALTDSLLESELFGHVKGAFTGAMTEKKGKLEVAAGGSVFLDEIGELAMPLQAKMLRVLQEREMERVGGTKTIPLDIRIIAATNRDLGECVRKGTFRQDLFYRLNVVSLQAPPLRERPEDILPLAEHFAKKFADRSGRKLAGISPDARGYLRGYAWPGNVRELENAMERAVVLGAADVILPEDLPESLREAGQPAGVAATLYDEAVENAKRQVVLKAFDQAAFDHEKAAKLLGLHPNYLHRLIRNLELKPVLKRSARP